MQKHLKMLLERRSPAGILGIVACIVGSAWVLVISLPFASAFGASEPGDWMMLFIIGPWMAAPGLFIAYSGFRCFREQSPKYIRRTVAGFAVFGILFIGIRMGAFLDKPYDTVPTLVVSLAFVFPYFYVSRWLINKQGLPVGTMRDYFGKLFIFIIALQLWFVGDKIVDFYGFYRPDNIDSLLALVPFVPMVAAWLFYKIAVSVWINDSPEPSATVTG